MMKRVLCLGNNTRDTDHQTTKLAQQDQMQNHGLLSELESDVLPHQYAESGYYHSSIYDIEFGRLRDLANRFDLVIMLDQPHDSWSHPDARLNTARLMKSLQVPCRYQDSVQKESLDYWSDLVKNNRSFCIFPWIEMLVNYDHTTLCCRSSIKITELKKLKDYANDGNYQFVRDKMLLGERLPTHCNSCYLYEDMGIISARQQETVEWANRLSLRSIHDLKQITSPVYYEIRPGNQCNLQCRMCNPESSHLIAREYKQLGLTDRSKPSATPHQTGFDIVDLQRVSKLYIAGGEPTIMPEFYRFLEQCVSDGRTGFEILVNTNGTKISQKLKKLLVHFKNLQFIFSIDGFRDINHYVRWPSDWDTIIRNWKYLRSQGHKITVNTTVSIYNVTSLHILYQYIDNEFPGTLVHAQTVQNPSHLSPCLHPDHTKARDSLEMITKTACYHNDQLFASTIDGLIGFFMTNPTRNQEQIKKFFEFNDLLDRSRSVRLRDYIPDLETYRT